MNDIEKIERLKNLIISASTDLNIQKENEIEYATLRNFLLKDENYKKNAPKFLKTCSNLKEYRREMQALYKNYVGRREHIKKDFYNLKTHY